MHFEAEEPAGLDDPFEALHTVVPSRPRVWSDAYLAAYARAGNYTLVTFDQGFRQFDGLCCTVLTPAP